jgi:hypothetical protein
MKNDTRSKRGHAIVRLKRLDRIYEGHTELDPPFIHFSGRRRVQHGEQVSYRAAGDFTWPAARIDEIRWIRAAA